jgi:Fe-S cluster assembly ATPase SufC
MSNGDIIIIVVYLIGMIFTIKYQKTKIDSLETQVKSQAGIMLKMEQFMNIFKIEQIEKYVEIMEKTYRKEKDEAIKRVEEEWKQKADRGMQLLMNEYLEVIDFSIKTISANPSNITIERFVNEMKEGTIAKTEFLRAWKRVRTDWEKMGNLPMTDSMLSQILNLVSAQQKEKS